MYAQTNPQSIPTTYTMPIITRMIKKFKNSKGKWGLSLIVLQKVRNKE